MRGDSHIQREDHTNNHVLKNVELETESFVVWTLPTSLSKGLKFVLKAMHFQLQSNAHNALEQLGLKRRNLDTLLIDVVVFESILIIMHRVRWSNDDVSFISILSFTYISDTSHSSYFPISLLKKLISTRVLWCTRQYTKVRVGSLKNKYCTTSFSTFLWINESNKPWFIKVALRHDDKNPLDLATRSRKPKPPLNK